jgi:predicted nucleic acid-binding protein
MALYFLDSSALVKRYISETGSVWVLGLFAAAFNNEIFIAAIAKVEIVAAITRRSRTGSISVTDATAIVHQLRKDSLKDYQVIEITERIIDLLQKSYSAT